MKIMLITFFDIMCIVYFKFILQGQTDNQPYMEMWKYRNGYVKLGVERKA